MTEINRIIKQAREYLYYSKGSNFKSKITYLTPILKIRLRKALRLCRCEYEHNWRRYVRNNGDLRVTDYRRFIPKERALNRAEVRIRSLLWII